MAEEIDTFNKFMVGVGRGGLCFIMPPPPFFSKKDALNMAAWLVALAEEDEGEFDAILKAVLIC